MNDLKRLEHYKDQFPSLDYLITEDRMFIATKSLQNNKSAKKKRNAES